MGLVGYADIYGVGVGSRYHRHAVPPAGDTPVEGVTVHPACRGRDRQRRVIRHNVIKPAFAVQALSHTLRRVGGVDQIARGCPRRANDGARRSGIGISGYRHAVAGGRTLNREGISPAGAGQLRRQGGKGGRMGPEIQCPEVNAVLGG